MDLGDGATDSPTPDVGDLAAVLRDRRVVALTGAGCSTESGIPDYRGPDTPPRRAPMQHREFVDRAEARRRYWARSVVAFARFAAARPNPAHLALAELERRGVVTGLITQNVDGLHARAGSREVIELHGAIARVRCLACSTVSARDLLQTRLEARNPGFLEAAASGALAPDGDADLADELVASFDIVVCQACGGVLMPDVVFFGGSVPRPLVDRAFALLDGADALLVVGSSLTVFSGFRFVKKAAERGLPVAILNRGPTRGDPHAAVRLDARAGQALPALVQALGPPQATVDRESKTSPA